MFGHSTYRLAREYCLELEENADLKFGSPAVSLTEVLQEVWSVSVCAPYLTHCVCTGPVCATGRGISCGHAQRQGQSKEERFAVL